METYVQPQIYGIGAAGVKPVKKKASRSAVAKPAAVTPEGEGPFDLVNAWAEWMSEQTGIPAPRVLRDRLMSEVKTLILEGYGSSDLKWALAIWSTKLARNLNTSPKELPTVAWKYRMDTSQQGAAWRDRMRESTREMGKNGVSAAALGGTPAEQKVAQTRSAASEWARRQQEKDTRR